MTPENVKTFLFFNVFCLNSLKLFSQNFLSKILSQFFRAKNYIATP